MNLYNISYKNKENKLSSLNIRSISMYKALEEFKHTKKSNKEPVGIVFLGSLVKEEVLKT